MARRAAYRKKRQNRFGMLLVSMVVIMLMVVVAIKSIELREKKARYAQKEQTLIEQIEAETKRSEEIDQYEKYTQTMKYIEDVAKDRLGLVYEGEIIFKDENN
ncbi:MAG: septum formation initiator family protein [Lachnospiraceae bacterium]|nr:septum formation initiator family protein [Lachnospiraceae bacterium]MDE6976790.1 septum formation initiator family protein [Lachnospiraceae bacterium]